MGAGHAGRHRWFKPAEEQAKNKSCRLDWFQSDTHVVVTLFAKCIDPERSSVKLNSDSVLLLGVTLPRNVEMGFPRHEVQPPVGVLLSR